MAKSEQLPNKRYLKDRKFAQVMNNRAEVILCLEELKQEGYQWIVRNEDWNCLSVFSMKPKKYAKNGCWGYKDPYHSDVKISELIMNEDITEINWENEEPFSLDEFIKNSEVAKDPVN